MLEGAPLGRALPGRVGLEIRATVQGGLRILEKIERVGAATTCSAGGPVSASALDWPLLHVRMHETGAA